MLEALPVMPELQNLNISNNRFDERSLDIVFGHAVYDKTVYNKLVDLQLWDVNLGKYENGQVFDSLLQLLSNESSLIRFYFGNNKLSPSKINKILSQLSMIPTLIDLELGSQTLDEECALTLCQFLKQLKYLDLTNCNLADNYAWMLIAPISESENIKQLVLDSNSLSDKFMKEFCSTLKAVGEDDFKYGDKESQFRQTPNLGMNEEEFTINASSEDYRTARSGLSNLGLANNNFSDHAIDYFCDLISSGSSFVRKLQIVDLSDNNITESGKQKISKALIGRQDLKININ